MHPRTLEYCKPAVIKVAFEDAIFCSCAIVMLCHIARDGEKTIEASLLLSVRTRAALVSGWGGAMMDEHSVDLRKGIRVFELFIVLFQALTWCRNS